MSPGAWAEVELQAQLSIPTALSRSYSENHQTTPRGLTRPAARPDLSPTLSSTSLPWTFTLPSYPPNPTAASVLLSRDLTYWRGEGERVAEEAHCRSVRTFSLVKAFAFNK